MSTQSQREKHSEKVFPLLGDVTAILAHEDCPDPDARITHKSAKPTEKPMRPARPFRRATELRGCTPGKDAPVLGVKVIDRRPSGLQEVHVHTSKPSELLAFIAAALVS